MRLRDRQRVEIHVVGSIWCEKHEAIIGDKRRYRGVPGIESTIQKRSGISTIIINKVIGNGVFTNWVQWPLWFGKPGLRTKIGKEKRSRKAHFLDRARRLSSSLFNLTFCFSLPAHPGQKRIGKIRERILLPSGSYWYWHWHFAVTVPVQTGASWAFLFCSSGVPGRRGALNYLKAHLHNMQQHVSLRLLHVFFSLVVDQYKNCETLRLFSLETGIK